MKLTEQLEIEAPIASVALVAGQPVDTAPGGSVPVNRQSTSAAAAGDCALLLQVSVQVTGDPTGTDVGVQEIDEVVSASAAART